MQDASALAELVWSQLLLKMLRCTNTGSIPTIGLIICQAGPHYYTHHEATGDGRTGPKPYTEP